ncbi:hypothetical protein HDV02_006589 [Globomyces sp. JEL0801]|nr:hypothetical protein HDV02_006589 [Globomyces sp. JEL0801]
MISLKRFFTAVQSGWITKTYKPYAVFHWSISPTLRYSTSVQMNSLFNDHVLKLSNVNGIRDVLDFIIDTRENSENQFHKHSLNSQLFIQLMRKSQYEKDFNAAITIYNLMIIFHLKPPAEVFEILLDFCVSEGSSWDSTSQIYNRFLFMGHKPTISIFNSLMALYSSSGNLSEVMRLFEEMKRNNIQPNTEIYNTLIRGCIGRTSIETLKNMYCQMLKMDIYPNTQTFSLLIDASTPLGSDYGDQWYNIMQGIPSPLLDVPVPTNPLIPDSTCNESLFNSICKYQSATQSYEYLKIFAKKGGLTQSMYLSYFQRFEFTNNPTMCITLSKEMISLDMFDSRAGEVLVPYFFRVRLKSYAESLISMMIHRQIPVTSIVYHSLIQQRLKNRSIVAALGAFRDLINSQLVPQLETLNILMDYIVTLRPSTAKRPRTHKNDVYLNTLQFFHLHSHPKLRNYNFVVEFLFQTYIKYESELMSVYSESFFHKVANYYKQQNMEKEFKDVETEMMARGMMPTFNSLENLIKAMISKYGFTRKLMLKVNDYVLNYRPKQHTPKKDLQYPQILSTSGFLDSNILTRTSNSETSTFSRQSLEIKLYGLMIHHYCLQLELQNQSNESGGFANVKILDYTEQNIHPSFRTERGIFQVWNCIRNIQDFQSNNARESIPASKLHSILYPQDKQTNGSEPSLTFSQFTKSNIKSSDQVDISTNMKVKVDPIFLNMIIRYCELNQFWRLRSKILSTR